MTPSWKKFFAKKTANKCSREEFTRASSSGEFSSPVPAVSSTGPLESGSSRDKPMPVVEQLDNRSAMDSVLVTTQQKTQLGSQRGSDVRAVSPKGKREKMTKARAILSRPFSRNSIPHKHGQRNWVVEVSPAEWDGDQSRWKYRILLQRRQLQPNSEQTNEFDIGSATSFTTAFTWRSLADFAWLEEALRAEYHGALLLPLLNIAIGTPDLASTQYEVDAALLRDWFGDVLNGIRGHGELVIDQASVDLMSSEALEAFLYRNTDPLPIVASAKHMQSQSLLPSVSTLDLPWKDSPETDDQNSSFVSSLWLKPFNVCATFDTLCAAGTSTSPDDGHEKPRVQHISMDLMRAHCSSRALESTPSLEIQDSFVQYELGELDSSNLAIQPQLVDAESELIESYRRSSLSAMERLRLLKEEESLVAGAWKRFAISLSNLYSYEKEVEGSRVGEAKEGKDNMPYRKLGKGTVDELLRVLARQKLDRSVSSLAIIDSMLRAYVGDLSAVGPSVKSYKEAVSQLSHIEEFPQQTSSQKDHRNEGETGWQGTIKALYGMVEITKHDSVQTATTTGSSCAEGDVLSQRKAFENRVFANERLLRESLTALCRATPIRGSRMAHHFLTAEEVQATLLSSAAISLRTKINVADPEILQDIKIRHAQESELDDATEMALVHRLINLGNAKVVETKPVSFPVEIGEGSQSGHSGTVPPRDRALQIAQDRLGKWDSELALALMEAIGIDDAEVQLEETTRDLRLVRRHAIGLRENLSRCLEALGILKSAMLFGQHDSRDSTCLSTQSIREARRDLFDRCSLVFSGLMPDSGKQGQPKSVSPSMSILENAGIPMNDPAGWLMNATTITKSKGRCGSTMRAYMDSRDADAEALFDKLDHQLKEYRVRVETIESFVYMQCVGIQLEKHFSKARANALAAFEKKTDIQTAINIAQRKRLPLLVQELTAKLDAIAPGVTHTTVKESKEAHLLSKTLKGEIGNLALRRFQRAKETAMDRVVSLMTTWANYEEVASSKEQKFLCKAVDEVERSLMYIDVSSDGLSHLVEVNKSTRGSSIVEA